MAGRLSNLKASFHSMATHPSARLAMACTILGALANSQQVGRVFNRDLPTLEEAHQQVQAGRIFNHLAGALSATCLHLEEALGRAPAKLLVEPLPLDSLLTIRR